MSGMRWDENYSVGVANIDDEHKAIIDMINAAYSTFNKSGDTNAAWEIINGMKEYAASHFSTEEKYMHEQAYPEMQEHKAEHQYFIGKVCNYETEAEKAGPNAAELYRFLSGWLIGHIMNCDKKLGSFLIEKGLR